jgi:hypothetical protein
MTEINAEMRRCIDSCLNCHATCEATLSYCMARDGAYADRTRMLILLDCAEICRTSAGFLLRGSALHLQTCATCAEICTECADWCNRLQRDSVMKQCAATCRECAQSCEEMAKMH